MISLTTAAKHHIENISVKHEKKFIFRLWVKKTGCSGYMYMPEMVPQPRPTDEKIKIDSLCIYVDRDAVSLIRGTEIDYVQKHAGVHQLVFNNPNADNVCGCGESFNLKEK